MDLNPADRQALSRHLPNRDAILSLRLEDLACLLYKTLREDPEQFENGADLLVRCRSIVEHILWSQRPRPGSRTETNLRQSRLDEWHRPRSVATNTTRSAQDHPDQATLQDRVTALGNEAPPSYDSLKHTFQTTGRDRRPPLRPTQSGQGHSALISQRLLHNRPEGSPPPYSRVESNSARGQGYPMHQTAANRVLASRNGRENHGNGHATDSRGHKRARHEGNERSEFELPPRPPPPKMRESRVKELGRQTREIWDNEVLSSERQNGGQRLSTSQSSEP